MADIHPDNKQIARRAAGAFGGTWRVRTYWDDPRRHSVDLLSCAEAPAPGLTSYSTVTLSNHPLLSAGREFPVRVELVGACDSSVEGFANALVTAALFVIKDKWFCRPGVVFETLLSMYSLSETMEHLYFTAPSQWPDLDTNLELPSRKVTWLWAIPISETESRFVAEHGGDRFESLLEKAEADVFDINRASVV
jgi:hypothetical protein